MLRNFVGFLADLCPNTVFYSPAFAVKVNGTLAKYSTVGPEGSPMKMAMVSLACALGQELKPGDECESKLYGVTSSGVELGDYEIIIRRKR